MSRLSLTGNSRTRKRLADVSEVAAAPTTPVAGSWGWWDATVGVTGGATVTQWDDQSGNARHLTVGAAASPSSGTRSLNSKNVIDFDGTNDGLGRTASVSVGMTNYTVIFVGGQDDTAVNAGFMSLYLVAAGHDYDTSAAMSFNTANHPGSKVIAVDTNVFVGGGGLQISGGTGATPTAVWAVRKTGSTVVIHKNGVSQGTGSATATGTSDALSVGWRAKEAGNYINGFIAKLLIYTSALSDGDMALNYSYLGNKWAL